MKVALEKGYQIQKIYEVWHFEESSEDLFKGYVRKFMKIKMQSSPMTFGEGCKYENENGFKQIIKEKLDITLDKIEYNPGMRAIAKFNSLWGSLVNVII